MHHYSLRKILSLSLLVIIAVTNNACRQRHKKPSPSGFVDETFTNALQGMLKPVDTAVRKKIPNVGEAVRLTYQTDEYQPIWVKVNYKPTAAAGKLLEELEELRWDGLDPEKYQLAALKLLKTKLDTTKKNDVADAIKFDTGLTHSYLAAARDLLVGVIVPKKVDSLWYHVNDSVWNAPQLLADPKGAYTSLDSFRSKMPTYQLLREEYKRYTALQRDSAFGTALGNLEPGKHQDSAMLRNIHLLITSELPWVTTVPNDTVSEQKQLLTAYQMYKGIQVTGKLDSNTLAHLATPIDTFRNKLRANMERVRWMQRQFGDLYLVVDVPLAELYLRKNGVNVMHMRVVVGKPERQTPSLFATMANVVINPAWGVPPTILKQDVIPGLQKSGKKYLIKKGLKAYDKEGNPVAASALNAKNYKKFTYKQAPGDDNSLGYVKFNLPNPWDIYLHDTPHRDDFGKRLRTLSSGCIRLQRPLDMAVYILGDLEKRNFTAGKLDTIISTHKTRWEVLKNKIPVHIAYLTAFDDSTGKHIQFARDVYHRDDKLILSLN
jgi:murein L,D-transpeptidase YcbB/YkuD